MIKIDFEFDTVHGVFRDAIYLPPDHNFTVQQIEDMKTQRLNNWIAVVEAPPPPPPELPPPPPESVTINGETYTILEGTPPSGSHLVEVNGTWYYRM